VPSSAIQLTGLVLDGNAANQTGGTGHGIALLTQASSIVDCMVQNVLGSGIVITDHSSPVSYPAGYTATVSCPENGIYRCRVYMPGQNGIWIQEYASYVTDGYIEECIIDYDFSGSSSSVGILVANMAGWRVIGNHVYALPADSYHLFNCDEAWIERNSVDNFGQLSLSGETYYGFQIQVAPYGRTSIRANRTNVNESVVQQVSGGSPAGSGAGNFIHYSVSAQNTSQSNDIAFIDNGVRQIAAGSGQSTGYYFNPEAGGALTVHGVTEPFTVTTTASPPAATSPYPNITSAGTVLSSSGTLSFPGYRGPVQGYQPVNPGSTTSISLVMAGLGLQYTPAVTGKLRVQLVGGGKTATAMAGIAVGLRYGTGSPPGNLAPATGTGFGSQQFFGAPSTSLNGQFALNGVITGLTPGTTYWFDVAFDTTASADAASLVNISAIIEETA
jgi:hypothetical protein